MVQVILSLPPGVAPTRSQVLHVPAGADGRVGRADLDAAVAAATGLPDDAHWLACQGRAVADDGVAAPSEDGVLLVTLQLRLRGGKGGFGSMLRSQGGRMASKQSTNYESCRDLNGRRLKIVSDAKAYNEWKDKEEQLRKEKEERRKRKMELALAEEDAPPKKHFLEDPNYLRETEELAESVTSAVDEGLQQSEKLEQALASKKAEAEKAVQAASKRLGMWYVPTARPRTFPGGGVRS